MAKLTEEQRLWEILRYLTDKYSKSAEDRILTELPKHLTNNPE